MAERSSSPLFVSLVPDLGVPPYRDTNTVFLNILLLTDLAQY